MQPQPNAIKLRAVTRRDLVAALSQCATINDEMVDIESRLSVERTRFGFLAGALRRQKGIGLREMARRCGMSAQMLSDFESGRRWSAGLSAKVLEVLR